MRTVYLISKQSDMAAAIASVSDGVEIIRTSVDELPTGLASSLTRSGVTDPQYEVEYEIESWLTNPVPPTLAAIVDFRTSTDTITADDVDVATLTYENQRDDAPADVTFDVNGATETVAVTAGIATLDVTSAFAQVMVCTVDALPNATVLVEAQ